MQSIGGKLDGEINTTIHILLLKNKTCLFVKLFEGQNYKTVELTI